MTLPSSISTFPTEPQGGRNRLTVGTMVHVEASRSRKTALTICLSASLIQSAYLGVRRVIRFERTRRHVDVICVDADFSRHI